ncbi:MAG: ParB/Srx family N-terminal domain-containing protein [Opitutaceae bacterium]|nr:ParB/Srx family N-terminal domain-containing protein [Opitutaceae bacterium]
MNIEFITISDLKPLEKNARTHTPEQIDKVAKSIKQFGFRNPVLITDSFGIVAGNCRVEAAKKLGIEKIPCLRLAGMTPEHVRAYALADNKLALEAGWDIEILKQELEFLQGLTDFDFDCTGFTQNEINDLILPPNDAGREFADNGEFDYVNEDKSAYRKIVVNFQTEADVIEFARRLEIPVTERTHVTWFPHIKREKSPEIYE